MPILPVPLDVRRDLQTLHDRMARQYVAKAYDAMVALAADRFAPEFRFRKLEGPDQTLLSISDMRDDELARAARGQGDGPVPWPPRLDGWTLRGGTLTVVAHHDVDGTWLKPDGRHPVHFRSAVRETWVRRDGGWKALRFQEVWMRGTMDGRTVQFGRASRPPSRARTSRDVPGRSG